MDKIGSKDPIYVLIDPQSTSAVISRDASLSDEQLIALAETNEKVLALRRAITSSASKTLFRYISLALFSIALLITIILIRKRNPVRSLNKGRYERLGQHSHCCGRINVVLVYRALSKLTRKV